MPGGSSADTSITSSRTCSRASRALKICKTCTLTRRGARSRMRCATSRRSRGSLPASSRSSHRRTRRSQSTSSKSPAPTSARPDRERTMLTQAINTTRQIASSIAALPASSAGIKTVQAHVATFVTGTLPSVVEVQQATLALARDALSRIEPLLAPGTLAQALIDTLAALRKEATALQAVVTGTATSVANAVDQLSADAGTLTNEAIQINAQVASLNAQRDAHQVDQRVFVDSDRQAGRRVGEPDQRPKNHGTAAVGRGEQPPTGRTAAGGADGGDAADTLYLDQRRSACQRDTVAR